jgi:DNA-directed RNA polymerase specialized sigma54-like protein
MKTNMDLKEVIKKQKELNSQVDWEELKKAPAEQYVPKIAVSKTWEDQRGDKISYAQSFNLAVAVCAEWFSSTNAPTKEQKECIENWQKWFYEKLTQRNDGNGRHKIH